MRIAVDMDEVLADTHAAKLALFADRFGYDWSDAELRGRKFSDLARPEHAEAMESIQHAGIFFADLPLIDGAVDAIARLNDRHEVFIASAAMEYPASGPHKVAWLARHFPFIDPLRVVLCGDKSILAADILIDDSPRHFERFRGRGVLFSAPHNAGHPHPIRLNGWDEFDGLLDRLNVEVAA